MIAAHERPVHRVSIAGSGAAQRLAIDGQEILACTSAVLRLEAGQVPELEMSLFVMSDLATAVPARVLLDDPTTAALIAMGWTPPGTEVS